MGGSAEMCFGVLQVLEVLLTPTVDWSRNVERFRGGLVFKAHILVYHSTLGSRAIKKKKK